jgi:hypothetical protein
MNLCQIGTKDNMKSSVSMQNPPEGIPVERISMPEHFTTEPDLFCTSADHQHAATLERVGDGERRQCAQPSDCFIQCRGRQADAT